MIYTALGIAVAVIVVWGYTNFKAETPEVSSVETTEEVSFEQKQKCASYRTDIELKIADEYEWSGDAGSAYSELDEIWYSTSRDSCLYSFKQRIVYSYDAGTVNSYGIYDYLQNTTLLDIADSNNPNASAMFEQKKLELR